MSRSSVRQAIYTFLQEPAVDGINKVFISFPKRINFQELALPGQNNRCVAVVFIENERDSRIAVPAVEGWKRVDYDIAIQLFHHSSERYAEDAMENFDSVIDNLKDKLRSDPRFGDESGTIIWQAVQPNLDVSYGEPLTQNGTYVETWAAVRFVVTEMIRA